MAAPLFRIGETLRGRLGSYIITKTIQDNVWLAKNQAAERVIVKGVLNHPRGANERDVTRAYQDNTPHIRPVIDEIQAPHDHPTIVLKHLDNDLWNASNSKTLHRKELKHVARSVLEALQLLHDDGIVHTDIKPQNILVDYGDQKDRFANVQLADFGSASHVSSIWAEQGAPIGAKIWTSPEAIMETPWNTTTDIWSFGTVVISLIYGGGFNLFVPKMRPDEEDYPWEVLKEQFKYFGAFTEGHGATSEKMRLTRLCMMEEVTPSGITPFANTTEDEVCQGDKDFLCRIMKLDWRERPTAREILRDKWLDSD